MHVRSGHVHRPVPGRGAVRRLRRGPGRTRSTAGTGDPGTRGIPISRLLPDPGLSAAGAPGRALSCLRDDRVAVAEQYQMIAAALYGEGALQRRRRHMQRHRCGTVDFAREQTAGVAAVSRLGRAAEATADHAARAPPPTARPA